MLWVLLLPPSLWSLSPLDFIPSGFKYWGFRRYAESLALVDRESDLPPAGLCGTEPGSAHNPLGFSVFAPGLPSQCRMVGGSMVGSSLPWTRCRGSDRAAIIRRTRSGLSEFAPYRQFK